MRVALIGESASGKTTLFSALAGVDYHRAVATDGVSALVKVLDPRLKRIEQIAGPRKKIVVPLIDFVDARSLRFDDEREQNREILASYRESGGLVVTIKCCDAPGDAAALRKTFREGVARIRSELFLADAAVIEKRLEKLKAQMQRPSSATREADQQESEILEKVLTHIMKEDRSIFATLTADMSKRLRGFQFLSAKPHFFVANLSERHKASDIAGEQELFAAFPFKLEHELLAMEPEERKAFMADYGVTELTVEQLARKIYYAMGWKVFFTVGKDDITSWDVPKEATALESAGRIHTDIQKGFICAEIVSFNDWVEFGSYKAAADKARARTAGKEHLMQDGDIVNFRFNVSK